MRGPRAAAAVPGDDPTLAALSRLFGATLVQVEVPLCPTTLPEP